MTKRRSAPSEEHCLQETISHIGGAREKTDKHCLQMVFYFYECSNTNQTMVPDFKRDQMALCMHVSHHRGMEKTSSATSRFSSAFTRSWKVQVLLKSQIGGAGHQPLRHLEAGLCIKKILLGLQAHLLDVFSRFGSGALQPNETVWPNG